MGVVSYMGDSLKNLVANLGTPRDKAAGSFYAQTYLSDAEAMNAYRGAWLPQKIVDIPALDACRNWRAWNAEAEQISAIEAEETRLGVRGKVLEALVKARLFGGAAIYIGTGDADPMKPLDPARIGKGGIKHLNVLSRKILQAGEIDSDPESALYGLPSHYTITSKTGQARIHPSRLVRFIGAPHPDLESATGQEAGWGDSVLLAITQAIKQADGTSANIASLVFEAKIDVIKVPGLMQNLAGDGEYQQQLLNRLTLAATAKGINGTLMLDSEEDYQQKSASFATLPEIMMAFLQQVSGAADIPMTRLLGQSPGGMNASGDSDIRNYYDRIKAMQELSVGPAMAVLDECLIRSALGDRPSEVFYDWRSLWQVTNKERADIGKVTADTIKTLADTRLIPEDVLSDVAVNMLTESGVAPGLESAMAGYVAPDDEGEGDIEAAGVTDAAPMPLYVRRDVLNVEEIAEWAVGQGITNIAGDLHVTVAYSRAAFDWIKAGNAKEWAESSHDTITIPEGGPRAVEPLGGMSAVILFASSQLSCRHEAIRKAGASHDFPDYTPHISLTESPVDLSKVEPYRGRIVLGPEIFEELREG